jgi:hypothetical protein
MKTIKDMNFQNWKLWIIFLVVIFYMDFEMVKHLMVPLLETWLCLNNILKKLNLKILQDGICRIYLWIFELAKKGGIFKSP